MLHSGKLVQNPVNIQMKSSAKKSHSVQILATKISQAVHNSAFPQLLPKQFPNLPHTTFSQIQSIFIPLSHNSTDNYYYYYLYK